MNNGLCNYAYAGARAETLRSFLALFPGVLVADIAVVLEHTPGIGGWKHL
jgi:hypothetical protein